MALERRCLTSHRSVESNKPVDTAPLLDIALTNEQRQSPLSGGRAQSLRRGASGMDAARGVKGHGWPLYAGPRSGDGVREVERSETRMEGQDLLVPFGATAKRDSPSRAKPEPPGNSAIGIDSMQQTPRPELIRSIRTNHIPEPPPNCPINQKPPEPIQPPPHSSNRHIHLFPCPHALARSLATETR